MEIPADLRYTKDHEWVREGGGVVAIGITAFAVDQLGDITLVELPEPGAAVSAGGTMGTIESVKSVSDIYSPLSGKVVRVNERLEDQPELVNESPYQDGWMVEIEPSGSAAEDLMDATTYAALVREQE